MTDSPLSVQIICISGNIASGKTTLINEIKRQSVKNVPCEIRFILEPLDKWGQLIKEFGVDKKRVAYNFQRAVIDHYEDITCDIEEWERTLQQEKRYGVVVVERSIIDVIKVFMRENKQNMSRENYQECRARCLALIQHRFWKNSIVIALEAPSSLCMRRIQIRNRDGETTLSQDYIAALENRYHKIPAQYRLQSYTENDIAKNCKAIYLLLENIYNIHCCSAKNN